MVKHVQYLAAADPVLSALIQKVEVKPLKPHINYFQSLIEMIIGQQLSDKVATILVDRFKALFGTGFPSPRKILETDDKKIRAVGISFSKISYIKNIAHAVENDSLDLKAIDRLSDQRVIEELTRIKGIGPWTAEMFLIFTLARPDVFSCGDLGLKNAIKKLYRLRKEPDKKKLETIAKAWSPYRSYACLYLWKSLDDLKII